MLSVTCNQFTLSVIMLSVVMLSVVILNVVAPDADSISTKEVYNTGAVH